MHTRYLEVNEILTNLDIDRASAYLSALKIGDIVDVNVVGEEEYDTSDFILTLLKKGSTFLALDNTYFGFEGANYTIEEILEGAGTDSYSYNIVSYK